MVRIRSRDGAFVQGEISRVGTNESSVFRDLSQILAFIVAQLGSVPDDGLERDDPS